MSGARRVLLIILVLLGLVIGTFIWFVATWDPAREESITRALPAEGEQT